MKSMDHGPKPYVAYLPQMAVINQNFRTAVWTGTYLQMTLMSLQPYEDIGLERHPETDQLLRVESGHAIVQMGKCQNRLDFQKNICTGDAVFVPAGIWHNIINTGRDCLKLSSIYAPPNHPNGTVQQTKADAEDE
jgi:mannose-6-phosphate isomerase-like protein (cupin superfamily)